MLAYSTLERSWYALTPGGCVIRVEERWHDHDHLIAFFASDQPFGGERIERCPRCGQRLTMDVLDELQTYEAFALA